MPKNEALATVPGRWSPMRARIWSLETKAWTTPERVKPSTSAQRVSQNMKKASRRDRPTSRSTGATESSVMVGA